MNARLPLLFAAFTAVLVLGGCRSAPPAPVDAPWTVEDATAMTRFNLYGKVGFRRGETGGSASLTWQQEGDRYKLAANGPLGQGATRIYGDASHIRIETGDGARESNNPEALLSEAIGWPVSIGSLAWWIRGVAAPGSQASVELDAEGRPSRIVQQDWEVRLDRWSGDHGRVLPHRIVATGGESRVTLLVHRWEFPGMRADRPATP